MADIYRVYSTHLRLSLSAPRQYRVPYVLAQHKHRNKNVFGKKRTLSEHGTHRRNGHKRVEFPCLSPSFLLAVPWRFLCCSSLFKSWLFRKWHWSCHCSSPFGAPRRLLFLIAAFPGYLHLYNFFCTCRSPSRPNIRQ